MRRTYVPVPPAPTEGRVINCFGSIDCPFSQGDGPLFLADTFEVLPEAGVRNIGTGIIFNLKRVAGR